MSIPTATLSSKYQISIPKEIRDSMNLKPGQKLAFLCIGKGGDPSHYRDRDTRREDILPRLSPAQNPAAGAVKPSKPTARKAVKKYPDTVAA